MLRQRVLVAIVLLPLGMAAIYFGGWYYQSLVATLLGLAAWEYAQLFHAGGIKPASVLVVAGTLAIVAGRAFYNNTDITWLIAAITLLSMAYHLFAYELGRDQAGTDFAVTISGVVYIGLSGSYLILLRGLPEGVWWVLTALPAVWLADSGAYFYGRKFGRRQLSPRLSPNKTWEGYIVGIITSVIGTALLAALWRLPAGPGSQITPGRGAVLGLIIATLAPLGDLGESMIKRQVGLKDSSNLIPGHGGAFDRIDSWLWAGVIAYHLIRWLFL
jgi:phosphatidate cytidylyltransferase